MNHAEYARALLRESAGYLAKGRPERAAEVEAELRRAGIEPQATVETTAAAGPPEKVTPPRPRR